MNNQVAYYGQPMPLAPPTMVVDTARQSGWWQALPDGTKRFVAVGGVVLVTAAIVGVIVLLARKASREKKAKKAQSQSFGDSKHATWAKQLLQAFENDSSFSWGTDEGLIRQVMIEIPTKDDFKIVADKYREMTKGRELVKDMSEELSSTEYEEMLAIKESKPQTSKDAKSKVRMYEGWAKRFHSAVNYHYWGGIPGTDDAAIKAVFKEIPTKQAFYDTARAYRKKYGISLWTDLDGDLDWSLDWRSLLKKK